MVVLVATQPKLPCTQLQSLWEWYLPRNYITVTAEICDRLRITQLAVERVNACAAGKQTKYPHNEHKCNLLLSCTLGLFVSGMSGW